MHNWAKMHSLGAGSTAQQPLAPQTSDKTRSWMESRNCKTVTSLQGVKQRTWVAHIMDASGKYHGGNLEISQLLGKAVIG